jgi:hypothetical protein
MYSVFEQCMNTAKSRHVVQTHDATADAQLVYAGLLAVYEENLSTSLVATDLRAELTLLRFNDTWKRGSEAFLQHWQSKILELEQLEDAIIDDKTKRLWLTATLSTKAHMASCLTQAKVTEMTMLGIMGANNTQMPWENFYSLILSHAKLHDHTTPPKPRRETHINERAPGRGNGRNRGGRGQGRSRESPTGRGNTTTATTPTAEKVWTVVTGPSMPMKANMLFNEEEYKKLSFAQKNQLRTLKGLTPFERRAPGTPYPPRVVNNAETVSVSNTSATVTQPSPESHLRQVLSSKSTRTPDDGAQQVTY